MDIPENVQPPDAKIVKNQKFLLALWLPFCAVSFIWFISKVLKGRRQIRMNFSDIEEQLRRLQTKFDEKEREDAIAEEKSNDDVQIQQQEDESVDENTEEDMKRNKEEHNDDNEEGQDSHEIDSESEGEDNPSNTPHLLRRKCNLESSTNSRANGAVLRDAVEEVEDLPPKLSKKED